jgi:hypothetical protein
MFQKSVKKIQVSLKYDKNNNIHEDLGTFLIVSCSILLTMRNISDRSSREIQNTHVMLKNFLPKNCAVYEIM